MSKRTAEIDGKHWEVAYPFCGGCPELVMGGTCAYEGNGCRYPEQRTASPISFARAFWKFAMKEGLEECAKRLGPCTEES